MMKAKRWMIYFGVLVLMCLCMPMAFAAEYTGTVNEKKVYFRLEPNTKCDYQWFFDEGDRVTVNGVCGNFYSVKANGAEGYVMKKFVDLPSGAEKKLDTVKGTAAKKVTAGTSAQSGISKISDITVPATSRPGDKGQDVKYLQQALKLKGFYSGSIDGDYGENTKKAVTAFQQSMKLSRDGVAGPATIRALFGKNPASSSNKTETAKATPKPTAKPTAKPVATPKPVSSSSGMSGISKISDITVPATSRPGDKGQDVKYLQQALKLKGFYSGSIDGDYGENTKKAVTAFQQSMKLSRDGVAGQATIRALFGKNPASSSNKTETAKATPKPTAKPTAKPQTYKTERLDWFNGGANIIPRGATFQVKDVNTGKVFTCRRWAGANHLDAEPKTSSDTAIMKEIYGGSWSWNRRAILVKYNGHVYAASMNGMPHGTSTISNGFNGHFCIHFYKSRTHETNRVDEAHQNAVSRAMNATW